MSEADDVCTLINKYATCPICHESIKQRALSHEPIVHRDWCELGKWVKSRDASEYLQGLPIPGQES